MSAKDPIVKATILGAAAAIAAASFVAGATILMTPRTASATPEYSAQTKLPCGRCHVNPAGAGPRTAFGKKFEENGHKLPSK